MKRLLICLLVVFLVNYGFAQKNQIGYIESGKNWHYVYDTQGKKLSVNTVGEVLSVSGETFTSRLGNWIYFWDKNGKKIGSRPAS
jgi:hypothetical protein